MLAIFVSPDYKGFVQSKIGSSGGVKSLPITEESTELSATLSRLSYGIDALSRTGATQVVSTGSTAPVLGVAPALNIVPLPSSKPEPVVYPLSVALEAKLLPDVFARVSQNK